jgi:hypothetical protein
MILPVDIANLKSPVLAETSPLHSAAQLPSTLTNSAQGALGNLTQGAVGQLFQAQVLSQLEDGTFLVSVAENALRMALPAGTNVGGTIPMTLLATEPRPAFLLEPQRDGTSPSLSDAAKVINLAIQSGQQTSAPMTLVGKTPLLSSPSTKAPEIAVVLQDSIEYSGLFYESHVSQWVDGQRPFSNLLREPQVQTEPTSSPQGDKQSTAVTSSAKPQVNNIGTLLQRPVATESELSRLITNVKTSSVDQSKLNQTLNALLTARDLPQEADTVVRTPVLTQQTAHNINLQLNTLEQHRVAWRGELWPGQQFEWEVSDDTTGRQQADHTDTNEPSWQSTVRFDLPKLGKISATIHLSGGHVQLRINTASESASKALGAHRDLLANALEVAGSPLDSLTIKQDEQA